ncbi:hypothetical protein B2G69_07940 [Methylorubrum zatmanii]|nr:DUF302 domain-containing protein [Methylorubrum zatmanii]ARO54081.1 hypothetical protein B2G69_07940 [Methylorubrum zatmanii]
MIQNITVRHHVHLSDRSYDAVVAAFREAVGSVEEGFDQAAAEVTSREGFEALAHSREGSSGFMSFLPVDHGKWLSWVGIEGKCVMFVLGNPLIAQTMMRHSMAVGLNVPVRLAIYEDADGGTRVAYDLPSSLMSTIDDGRVHDAALKLDAKLIALAEQISGATA